MNAAIYARYSSELQRATSIQDQLRLCRQAAERRGYAVADQHVYTDEEISGAVGNRPGYQCLLAAAMGRAFDAIIVEAQDRLWRDAAEMYAALKRLRVYVKALTNTSTPSRIDVGRWTPYPEIMRLSKEVRAALVKLGRIGGKKGGPKGGKARARAMTPEERREAARKAVLARWAKVRHAKVVG